MAAGEQSLRAPRVHRFLDSASRLCGQMRRFFYTLRMEVSLSRMGDWEDTQPTVMGVEEAWEKVHPQLFTYIHFFSGPIPERFEGIHEALNFPPSTGGANGAQLTALKAVMDKGAREGLTVQHMAPCVVCDQSTEIGHP